MKKVLLLSLMLVLVMLGINGVGAEELIDEVIAEPTAWDNWLNTIKDFGSIKNFVLSAGGLATLVTLSKVRSTYKFLKSPDGLVVIEKYAMKLFGKISESPELVMNITKLVVELPVIKNIVAKAEAKANMYETELLDKIVNLKAKISAKVFDKPEDLQQATLLLQQWVNEYENISTSE